MDELTRRDFLTAGTLVAAGGLLALGALGEVRAESTAAAAPGAAPAARKATALQALFPGSVDAAGKYQLPPLPYGYDAVSEVIDEQTMRLHHDKHHAAYVKGVAKAEEELAKARASADFSLIQHWSRQAAFHGAGHLLHCVFWDSIGPDKMGGEPSGALAEAIQRDLGGAKAAMAHFKAAAKNVEGNGWAILAYSLAADKLIVLQAMNHQLLTDWAAVPILCLDVWEHAYYLRYQNDRGAYVDAFEKVINWGRVGNRFALLQGSQA